MVQSQVVDYVFATIYILEFLLRLYTYGLPVLRSNWVKFDLFLILSSLLDIVLKQVAAVSPAVSEVLTQILLVRILRLARLARAVRLMVQFRVLWQLVQGLLHSVSHLKPFEAFLKGLKWPRHAKAIQKHGEKPVKREALETRWAMT